MNILVVCGGNSFRSPVAAALLESELIVARSSFAIKSAGLRIAGDPDASWREVAFQKSGMKVVPHTPRQLSNELLVWSEMIICWDLDHKVELASLVDKSVDVRLLCKVADPFVSGDYESALMQIREAISKLAKELLAA